MRGIYFLLILIHFFSCSNNNDNKADSDEPVLETINKKVNIDIKVFQNKDMSGYGYDIILDGHLYVHQPNVPALPGNNGFKSEAKAKSVAELVAFKIKNNIMPPTISVSELDSLGVK